MSRIGRMPIAIPAGVTVELAENNVNSQEYSQQRWKSKLKVKK